MFNFSSFIDLSLVFGIIIAIAIFMYVFLDGFDLGIGIIFPFAPSNKCRDQMMNSIAPFWDGNETWLVMGGGGLFAAFPLAYSILLPAFYIPIIAMLMGLIMRGVAFEFRFKASEETKKFWDYIFHFGSLIATFFQGVILGSFVSGINVEGRNFAGLPFDWATSFSIMTGIALVFGYSLLGSTWLIMKTQNITQDWARKVASYVLIFVAIFMILVSAIMPFLNERIFEFWFSQPNIYYLSILPICSTILFLMLWHDLKNSTREYRPFIVSIGLFLTGYIGIAISIYPYIIPYKYTIWESSASGEGLSLLLVGVAFLLPIILGYTTYCYYIFRGKTSEKNFY